MKNENGKPTLSPGELKILKLIANGDTDKVIADRLKLSIHTVGVNRTNTYKKLNAANAVVAVRLAIRYGWIKA